MDPLLLALEWWWIAPSAVGAGTLAAVGVRRRSSRVTGRRLAYDAARRDLKEARSDVGESRGALKIARAEHARLVAERSASRASTAEVSSARRVLRQAEQNAKAAAADVRARRVRVTVAHAEIPSSSQRDRYPLARLQRAHDAVTARWMAYETDPAKLIAYPAISDSREPATSAFLSASRRALDLRPAPGSRISTTEFAAYRDAVADLERAFDVAEHTAKARANGVDPDAAPAWQGAAQQVFTRSADAFDRAAGAAASALAAWNARGKPAEEAEPTPASPEPESPPPPASKIWPVPRRDS